jgi:hypothetical protein
VLYDLKTLVVGSAGNPDYSKYLEITIPGKQMKHISFNDATTAGEGQLYLVGFSTEVTNAPRLAWTARLGYSDA